MVERARMPHPRRVLTMAHQPSSVDWNAGQSSQAPALRRVLRTDLGAAGCAGSRWRGQAVDRVQCLIRSGGGR